GKRPDDHHSAIAARYTYRLLIDDEIAVGADEDIRQVRVGPLYQRRDEPLVAKAPSGAAAKHRREGDGGDDDAFPHVVSRDVGPVSYMASPCDRQSSRSHPRTIARDSGRAAEQASAEWCRVTDSAVPDDERTPWRVGYW